MSVSSVEVQRRDGTISRVEHEDITTIEPVSRPDGSLGQAYQDRFTVDGETRYMFMFRDEVEGLENPSQYRIQKLREFLSEFNIEFDEYCSARSEQQMASYRSVQRTKALPE